MKEITQINGFLNYFLHELKISLKKHIDSWLGASITLALLPWHVAAELNEEKAMQTRSALPCLWLANDKGECGYLLGSARFTVHTQARSSSRRYRRVSSSSSMIACLGLAALAFSQPAAGGPAQSDAVYNKAEITIAPGDSLTDALSSGGRGPEMVVVPDGSFMMGCVSGRDCQARELPIREVEIERAFALSRLEVTREEFGRFVEATGYRATGSCMSQDYGPERRRTARGWRQPGFRQTDNHPVTCVSWEDARAYVEWLSSETGQEYRLPTEVEWEYAARAGSSSRYAWGNAVGRRRANCATCESRWAGQTTAPAGAFAANAFGLHDMHGNVWEWVQDCPDQSDAGGSPDASPNRAAACAARILRGGSWSNLPERMRSASRSWLAADSRSFNLGFRVAREVAPATLMGGLAPQ